MRLRIGALALGAALLPALTGCGDDDSASDSTGVSIDAGKDSCDVAQTDFTPGEITFSVINSGDDITEVYVYGKQGDEFSEVIAEVEDIGPGVSRDLTVDLEAGEYQITCKPGMVDDNMVSVPITVE